MFIDRIALAPDRSRAGASRWARFAVALAVVWLLRLTATLLVPLICALLLSLVLSPAVEALQRRRVPGGLAAALLVFGPLLAVAGLAVAAAPALGAWWRATRLAIGDLGASAPPFAGEPGPAGGAWHWLLARADPDRLDIAEWFAREGPAAALAGAAVLMLVFFVLMAQRSLLAGVLGAMPSRRTRVRLLATLRDARRGVVDYFVVMALINLGLSVATASVLAAIGIAGAVAWAGIVFALLFVPYLGPLAIALLLAVAGAGGTASITAPAAFLGLHAVEAQFVSPWLMGRRLRLARPALVAAVIVGGWAGGVAGGVLAVPLVILWQVSLRHRPGRPLAAALLAGEDEAAPSLAASTAAVLTSSPRLSSLSVACELPPSRQVPTSCRSPTSPKPIRPKSTVSR